METETEKHLIICLCVSAAFAVSTLLSVAGLVLGLSHVAMVETTVSALSG